jgi:phospholipid transport system transporter-binding protein
MAGLDFEDAAAGRFNLKGSLVFGTVTEALRRSRELFADHQRIEIDLSGVESTDSAGLALLVEWTGWAQREGRSLRLHHLPDQALALARISEIDKLLPMK